MGILDRPAQVIEGLKLPAGFSVCELGNQVYRANGQKRHAIRWYQSLGAGSYASIDANGQATHFADLNYPLPAGLGQFDLVTDFGTGEHIFNQAQVWHTLHDLVKVGGIIAFDRPMTGWPGHCFYNIQPTLILDLVAANSYRLLGLEPHTMTGRADLGQVLFGLMQKTTAAPFQYPNQGKYKSVLQLPEIAGTPPMSKLPSRVKRWDVLSKLITENGWRKGAEIGVLNGKTFFELLEKHPALEMIAVDLWSMRDPTYGDLTDTWYTFQMNAARFGTRVKVLRGQSVEMAVHVADGALDFCFIDADHSYGAVSADIRAWAPKVRAGGSIMGHDIDHESVHRAVTHHFGAARIKLLPDDVWMAEAA